MDAKRILRGERMARMVFFLGFVGLIGWLGSSWFLYHICQWNDGGRLLSLKGTDSLTVPQSALLFVHAMVQGCFFLPLILPAFLISRSRLELIHDPCEKTFIRV